jgi:hypothetical protein
MGNEERRIRRGIRKVKWKGKLWKKTVKKRGKKNKGEKEGKKRQSRPRVMFKKGGGKKEKEEGICRWVG